MSTNGQNQQNPLSILLDAATYLHVANNPLVYAIMIREINNHLFLRANNTTVTGEMNEEDMKKILFRIGLATQEALPLRHGHATYKPNPNPDAIDTREPYAS